MMKAMFSQQWQEKQMRRLLQPEKRQMKATTGKGL